MKEAFSLRTLRKKLMMLSKLAGVALIFAYLLSTALPIGETAAFLLWLGLALLVIWGIDRFLLCFISKPLSQLHASAKRMASLDFSTPCTLSSQDEFGELADSLNTLADRLQRALARQEHALAERKELVDSLSHEMKTPLGIIRAYAEGIQEETDPAKQQKYAQVIVSEVARMNDLIVTLLDLSALESGAAALTPTRFDFVELLETVAGRLLLDPPDANFTLEYELPEQGVFVNTDRRRMEQVLENLMLNARKNVQPGGVLRLTLTQQEGALHFSLFNQGKPIPQEALPKLWDKFYRDSSAPYKGSGLGLSIVAQILSMQKLPYGVENQAEGVRFYFSLPVA